MGLILKSKAFRARSLGLYVYTCGYTRLSRTTHVPCGHGPPGRSSDLWHRIFAHVHRRLIILRCSVACIVGRAPYEMLVAKWGASEGQWMTISGEGGA